MSTETTKRGRGAYRGSMTPELERSALLQDPQVVAFARALERIDDPQQRACIAWLVLELAKEAKNTRK